MFKAYYTFYIQQINILYNYRKRSYSGGDVEYDISHIISPLACSCHFL